LAWTKKIHVAEKGFFSNLRGHAIFFEPDQIRVYPNGTLAAQVIGFPAIEEIKAGDHVAAQIIGRDGIEFAMQKPLSGVAGWRLTETDQRSTSIGGAARRGCAGARRPERGADD
jgi:cell division protein FtsI/penicillin-binding protein 2